MIRFAVKDCNGRVLLEKTGKTVDFAYHHSFQPGEKINVETDVPFLEMQLHPSMCRSIVYFAEGTYEMPVPFGDAASAYDEAWHGAHHHFWAAEADKPYTLRNIALNPADFSENTTVFPHISTTVFSGDRHAYAPRNAIDGMTCNEGHGKYPYQSYSPGKTNDFSLRLDFGRTVQIQRVGFLLRADYRNDHDTYRKSGTLLFSDGTQRRISLHKGAEIQYMNFSAPITYRAVTLCDFIQAGAELSFAALTELSVIGNYVKEETKHETD